MAYTPQTGGFFSYLTPEGDPGAGHIYLGEALPKIRQVGDGVADIILATGLVPAYREVYNKGFVNVTSRKIRRWTADFLTDKQLHAPTVGKPTFATAYEAVEALLLGGWGHSVEFARHHLELTSKWDLEQIAGEQQAALAGKSDLIPAIKEACLYIAQCIVESYTIDGWLDDGSPDLPWLPSNFQNEDGATTEMVRADDFIDPEMYDDGWRYTWAPVNRAGLVMWLWLNQRIVLHIVGQMNLVDSSRSHVAGTGG
ncbi:MAG: hypothetical protein IH828_08820 [Nitrospinae bacterium]|nr:hypothetical protein [Nitrospinota bacterium]